MMLSSGQKRHVSLNDPVYFDWGVMIWALFIERCQNTAAVETGRSFRRENMQSQSRAWTKRGKERSSVIRVETEGESDGGGSLWSQVSNQWGLWSVCLCQTWLWLQRWQTVVHREEYKQLLELTRAVSWNTVEMHLSSSKRFDRTQKFSVKMGLEYRETVTKTPAHESSLPSNIICSDCLNCHT